MASKSTRQTFLEEAFSIFRPKELEEPPRERDATITEGVSGTPVYGGYVNSNEADSRLTGLNRYQTYSFNLANVSIVAAGVRYFLNLTAGAGWKVEPPDDTPEAKEKAELVEEILDGMLTPWSRVIRRASMYRFYGFSIQEWTAMRRSDGVIGFLDIEARPQSTIQRWDVDRTGTVWGVEQRAPQDGEAIYLPRNKLVYLVDDSISDSPEGVGLFRHLAEPSKRLRRYEMIEGFGFENDLRGIPVGRIPYAALNKAVEEGTITKEQRAAAVKAIERMVSNHIKAPGTGLTLDSETYRNLDDASSVSAVYKWGLELVKGDGAGLEEVAEAIERVNRELARILGVEHLLLGTGEGSLALSRDKSHTFYVMVDGSLKEAAAMFDRDLINPLWAMNGWDPKLKPRMKPDSVQFRDVQQVTAALKDMATAGVPLDIRDPAVNDVRSLIGVSPMPETIVQEVITAKEEQLEAERAAAEAALNPPEDPEDPEGEQEPGEKLDEKPPEEPMNDDKKKPAKKRRKPRA